MNCHKNLKLFLCLLFAFFFTSHSSAVFAENTEAASIKDSSEDIRHHLWDATQQMTNALMAKMDGNDTQRLEHLNAAIKSYDAIILIDPSHVAALNGRGLCKEEIQKGLGTSDFENVINLTSSIITNNPDDATAFHDRATAYRSLQKFAEARADYKKAIELYKPEENELMDKKAKWELDLRAMETEAK